MNKQCRVRPFAKGPNRKTTNSYRHNQVDKYSCRNDDSALDRMLTNEEVISVIKPLIELEAGGYAIKAMMQGPDALVKDWNKITRAFTKSLSELLDMIGHPMTVSEFNLIRDKMNAVEP